MSGMCIGAGDKVDPYLPRGSRCRGSGAVDSREDWRVEGVGLLEASRYRAGSFVFRLVMVGVIRACRMCGCFETEVGREAAITRNIALGSLIRPSRGWEDGAPDCQPSPQLCDGDQ